MSDNVKKLYIKTHGCQMNEYDSQRMADILGDSDQMVLTDNAEKADVVILNTCSIREKAQEKVFHQLGRWKRLKDKNPNVKIGVAGCVASQEGDAIIKRASHVDMVFGPQTIHRLPNMVNQAKNAIQVVDVPSLKLKNLTIYRYTKPMTQAPLYLLWKAALSTVLSVSFLIRAVKRSAAH